jgi:hypothetical protein
MLPGNYADFGDARFLTKPDPALVEYLGRIFGFASRGTAARPTTVGQSVQILSLFVMTSFPDAASELKRSGQGGNAGGELLGLRTYYPDAGVLVARPAAGGRLAVTIKAGGNNGGHSHNDIGSFAIGQGATQPVGDPGGPRFYTSQTFSKDRFQSRLLNSFGHPVPVVAGRLQLDATKVHAPVLKTQFTDELDTFTINLTKAYDAPELQRLERTMRYSRVGDGAVEIEDRFEMKTAASVDEGLPTHGTWKQLDAQTLEITMDGERLRVSVMAPGPFEVTQDTIDEYGNPFTRIGIRLRMQESGSVRLQFTAVK